MKILVVVEDQGGAGTRVFEVLSANFLVGKVASGGLGAKADVQVVAHRCHALVEPIGPRRQIPVEAAVWIEWRSAEMPQQPCKPLFGHSHRAGCPTRIPSGHRYASWGSTCG